GLRSAGVNVSVPCPSCRKPADVPDGATAAVCPHCRKAFGFVQCPYCAGVHTVRRSATVFICPAMGVKVATPWKDEAIKASTNRGCLWWVVAGIVTLAVWAGISTASDEG